MTSKSNNLDESLKPFSATWALKFLESGHVEAEDFIASWINLAEVKNLQNTINYTFKNHGLFLEALMHSSFANQFPGLGINSYERLEYLGDGMIDAHVSEELFHRYKDMAEGELSKLRGSIVNESQFSQLSKIIGLNQCLLLGKGEYIGGGVEKPSLLGDVFEAFIAAIYLDSGWDEMRNVINKIFSLALESGTDLYNLNRLNEFDAKSRFQEAVIKEFRTLPEYRVEDLEGNNYNISVYVKGVALGSIQHHSKKSATKKLAKEVLNQNIWREKVKENKQREVENADD